jgi:hypothetical protein
MLKKAMLLGLLILPLSLPAKAQNVCTARDQVLGHLGSNYSETPVAMGLANNGGVIEVLSSGSGTTWTIIITMPSGVSCLLAAGESWESLPLIAAGPST